MKNPQNLKNQGFKKHLGQNFLRNKSIAINMIEKVNITKDHTIVEIGCGDGFLSKTILENSKCKNLICFEIDPFWIEQTKKKISDPRYQVIEQDILKLDWKSLSKNQPLIILANLPYQISFPIMFKIIENKNLIESGVVMVQEEVAQKIVSDKGKNFNHVSMQMQHNLELELMDKIGPENFYPSPKVNSRTFYFKPKRENLGLNQEQKFWNFLKNCFKYPRQTLKNNLKKHGIFNANLEEKFDEKYFMQRAQQLSFKDFKQIYQTLSN